MALSELLTGIVVLKLQKPLEVPVVSVVEETIKHLLNICCFGKRLPAETHEDFQYIVIQVWPPKKSKGRIEKLHDAKYQ